MKIVVINFSGRADGNCQSIAQRIADFYSAENTVLYSFSSFEISPCGKCNLQCFRRREDCPYFYDKEFDFFIFNERSQCYFQGHPELLELYESIKKKFIVVSNTEKENFTAAFAYHVKEEPEVLFLSAKEYNKVSIRGDLLTSAAAADRLLEFIHA